MTPRFLIDEQLLGALPNAIGLHNETAPVGIDALAVGDTGAPPRGTEDVELLRWREREPDSGNARPIDGPE